MKKNADKKDVAGMFVMPPEITSAEDKIDALLSGAGKHALVMTPLQEQVSLATWVCKGDTPAPFVMVRNVSRTSDDLICRMTHAIEECGRVAPEGYSWIAAIWIIYPKTMEKGEVKWSLELFHRETLKRCPPARNDPVLCRIHDCNKPAAMYCSRCANTEVRYCDVECQKRDWQLHARECVECVQSGVVCPDECLDDEWKQFIRVTCVKDTQTVAEATRIISFVSAVFEDSFSTSESKVVLSRTADTILFVGVNPVSLGQFVATETGLGIHRQSIYCVCMGKEPGYKCPHAALHEVYDTIHRSDVVLPADHSWLIFSYIYPKEGKKTHQNNGCVSILAWFNHTTSVILRFPASNHPRDCRIISCRKLSIGKCMRCMNPEVRYCSKECLAVDWPLHKLTCVKKQPE